MIHWQQSIHMLLEMRRGVKGVKSFCPSFLQTMWGKWISWNLLLIKMCVFYFQIRSLMPIMNGVGEDLVKFIRSFEPNDDIDVKDVITKTAPTKSLTSFLWPLTVCMLWHTFHCTWAAGIGGVFASQSNVNGYSLNSHHVSWTARLNTPY